MKRTFSQTSRAISGSAIPTSIALAIALTLVQQGTAATTAVDLGSASDFAILAGSGITVAGAVDSTTITGDIGSSPTDTITGLENVVLNGVNHGGNAVTVQGKDDLDLAYADAIGRTPDTIYAGGQDLGTLSLLDGVYNSPTSFSLNGNLTLDGNGDSSSVWIFQAGSTLITGSSSTVTLINGAQASNVFWQVGSSATLETNSSFAGSILALESITIKTNAELTGNALARNGAVTLDTNNIQIPEPSSTLLLSAGLVGLAMRRRRS